MIVTPQRIHKKVLYWHEIVKSKDVLCEKLAEEYRIKIVEVLLRWRERSSTWYYKKMMWADALLRIESGKADWIQKTDLIVLKKFFELYPLLSEKYKDTHFHINLNPLTLLDETYWIQLLTILWNNSYNREFYHKIFFEIIEIRKKFSKEEINRLNSKIEFLKDHYWINLWIDDFPMMSNNIFMLKNIKWIDFVKIDKDIALTYSKWTKNKADYKDLKAILKTYIEWIKSFHPDAKIILEWIENPDICLFIKTHFPEISGYQWHLFWKPIKL